MSVGCLFSTTPLPRLCKGTTCGGVQRLPSGSLLRLIRMCCMSKPSTPSRIFVSLPGEGAACRQGLTLVHSSARRKHFLWNTWGGFRDKKEWFRFNSVF